MKIHHAIWILILVMGTAWWLAGCDAEEKDALPNRPPTTTLTVAPNDGATVNHYIPLRWAANDPDGNVAGFWLLVDGDTLTFTATRDTILAFSAPADGTPQAHTFEVVAEDGEGLSDTVTTPAAVHARSRFFYAVNFAPVASFVSDATIPANSTTGNGFQVTLAATDSNPSLIYYSISLDDSTSGWTEWSPDSVFLFADPTVIADTTTFPRGTNGIPNTGLTVDPHQIYARVKDAGDAVSSIIWRDFRVEEGFRPLMDPEVAAQYGGTDLYPDGSAYHQVGAGVMTELAFSASASDYHGRINAYRYRMGKQGQEAWTDWSAWQTEASLDTAGLTADTAGYVFEIMARDLAGEVSDPLTYVVHIVRQVLSDSILVVGATADGNGNPGSPTYARVDSFYQAILDGYKVRRFNYADTTRGATPYVSPLDLQYAGLVIWHEDDRTDPKRLNSKLSVIQSYLNKGGRMVFSGWDAMNGFGSTDTLSFTAGSFAREYFQLLNAYRNRTRHVTGFEGVGGFSGCTIDSTKLPPNWRGLIDRCWVFRPKGHCILAGELAVDDSDTNPYSGATAAYLYDLSFRVAVFGVPLYFCHEDDVRTLFRGDDTHASLIARMLEGLGPIQ